MSTHTDDVATEPADGELVHWMEPKPVSLGLGGVTAAAAGAFVLGAVVALGVMALLQHLDEDEPAPRRWTPWR